MRARHIPFLAIAAISILGTGIACKRSAESRAQDASALVRSMNQEVLEAQKKAIAKFKALPNSDDYRLNLGANLDGWSVSDKNYSKREDDMEKSLIELQKNAKDEALIGELRLFAKKRGQDSQGKVAEFESRLAKTQKSLQTGKLQDDNGGPTTFDLNEPASAGLKKTMEQIQQLLPIEIEFHRESQRIANAYEAKLTKLLS